MARFVIDHEEPEFDSTFRVMAMCKCKACGGSGRIPNPRYEEFREACKGYEEENPAPKEFDSEYAKARLAWEHDYWNERGRTKDYGNPKKSPKTIKCKDCDGSGRSEFLVPVSRLDEEKTECTTKKNS